MFFLFGTGPRTIKRVLANGKVVMYRYRVFHMFFLLTAVLPYAKGYQLATETPDGWNYKAISDNEAKELLGGEELKPSFYAQWSLAMVVAVILIAIIAGQLAVN